MSVHKIILSWYKVNIPWHKRVYPSIIKQRYKRVGNAYENGCKRVENGGKTR